jgi:hypothetical protein
MDSVVRTALRGSKIRGVQVAIVVDNKDGNGNPGYHVKVKFPWLNEQDATFWARITIPMGGPNRGTYVLPEIDDQVLVVFEHRDINRPIVIGALWSKKQEPVEVNQSGKNNAKLIKSRCGHRVIFDDKDGAEKITIVDKTKKNKIVLDSVNKLVKIESDGDIEVIAKTNVIIHADALKIGTAEGVTGKASYLLSHAQKTFGLKATSRITIGGGNTTINISSASATSVSGSGAGELGGGSGQLVVGSPKVCIGGPVSHDDRVSQRANTEVVSRRAQTEVVFCIIEHGTGNPRSNLTLIIKGPDGAEFRRNTDSNGEVRLPCAEGDLFRLVSILDEDLPTEMVNLEVAPLEVK